MSDNKVFKGQEHYVSEVDETGLGAVDAVRDESAPRSMWGEAWLRMSRRPLFWFSAIIIVLAMLLAVFPWLFTSVDPNKCLLKYSLEGPSAGHIFGYNLQGCDIFARTIYGAKSSVTVGIFATLIVTLVGTVIGALAGFYGGIWDSLLSRVTDIFFAIPFVLAAIVVMQMFKSGRTIWTVILVLAIFGWPQIARITRGSVITIKNEEYVTASRSLGAKGLSTLVRHILPNAAAPIIVYATVALGAFIVAEATLSFLGLGLPVDIVSWGADISRAQVSLRNQPSVLFYPAGALAITVLGFIMMGDVVRDALDPKARR